MLRSDPSLYLINLKYLFTSLMLVDRLGEGLLLRVENLVFKRSCFIGFKTLSGYFIFNFSHFVIVPMPGAKT
jgi:hypothetical protein